MGAVVPSKVPRVGSHLHASLKTYINKRQHVLDPLQNFSQNIFQNFSKKLSQNLRRNLSGTTRGTSPDLQRTPRALTESQLIGNESTGIQD